MVRRRQWRKLCALLAYLPAEAATVEALAGYRPWTTTEHLLAALIDTVRINTWVTQRVAGSKAPRPKPLPRPGEGPKRLGRKGMSIEEVDARLASVYAKGGEP